MRKPDLKNWQVLKIMREVSRGEKVHNIVVHFFFEK